MLSLLHASFARHAGRIDPPSSLFEMSASSLAEKAALERVFVASLGQSLVGCGFGRQKDDALYLSKLAVHPKFQGRGCFREIIDAFSGIARDMHLTSLTLLTRVELTENHLVFEKVGFRKESETRHPGYDRTTSFFYRLAL